MKQRLWNPVNKKRRVRVLKQRSSGRYENGGEEPEGRRHLSIPRECVETGFRRSLSRRYHRSRFALRQSAMDRQCPGLRKI